MRRNEELTRKSKPLRTAGLVLAWASLTLLPLAATGCQKEVAASEEKSLVEVGTTNPQRKDLTRVVIQPGYLRPYEMTPIYTKIAGFAEEPIYDIGDFVKKDELLVKLRVPEVVQDLRVKKAKIKQAEADLKAAKAAKEAAAADVEAKLAAIKSADAQVKRWQAEEERSRRLVIKGVYDQQTADEQLNQLRASEALWEEARAKYFSAKAILLKAAADIEVADANVDVAKAAHDQWKDWLDYAQITAPFDGFVTDRRVHTGHFLQPANSGSTSKAAEPLFVMMRTDIMRCTVEVPELDALLVRKGVKAVVQFQAIPGVELVGEVTRTTKALDEHTRTLRVEVHLKNPDGLFLRPNMYANVTILPKLPNAWTLPPDAVMNDILANGDRSYCFVVEDDGRAHKVFLEIGAICDEGKQVLRKQRAGHTEWEQITGKEAVVITNNKALLDGQEVRLTEPRVALRAPSRFPQVGPASQAGAVPRGVNMSEESKGQQHAKFFPDLP